MKINIGPYINFIGPYQIAEKILFWLKEDDDRVHNFGHWLSEKKDGSPSFLTLLCEKIHQARKRHIYIRIDKYDSWNMDDTLSYIIVPLLKQLKETKHGIPSSVFQPTYAPEVAVDAVTRPRIAITETDEEFNHAEQAWNEIIDKMIWAFEQNITDWDEKFWTQKPELDWDSITEKSDRVKWLVEGKYDAEGARAHYDKMQEGFNLFGKHFKDLWD